MAKTRMISISMLILILSLAVSAMAIDNGTAAPGFDLKDQFGKNWNLSNLRGNVTVVIAANPDSGRLMGPWVDNLKTRYGSKVQIIGLMDLHSVPGIGRGIARSRIRKETSDPLMLDFNGSTARAYSVSDKYPVVAVIDKNGVVRALQKSTFTQQGFNSVARAIDNALK